ncbi:MAG: NAD(P)-dependent oxidoreductase [Thermodesulfovibrionales bacterium]|nr:NAD(P)-dependent oxidoreductase [Thermodesulfovibrionales bacterium]
MKAFVTGATGFIGSHLVEALLRSGFQVNCLRRQSSSLRNIEGLNIELVEGDCCKAESLDDVVADCEYVFHLAGLTKAKSSEDFYITNVSGTEILLSSVAKKARSLKRFFYLSSLAAVGPSLNGHPLTEDCQPNPVSDYGKSKFEGEQIVYSYRNRIPITIIRPPAVYGPRDRDFLVFFKMVKSGFIPYWGKSQYSFVYVEDLVRAIIETSLNEKAEGEIFFVSDGSIYTSDDFIEAVSNALEQKPFKISTPGFIIPALGIFLKRFSKVNIINSDKLRELRYKNWTCDSTKINKVLNFTPKVKLKEGVKWTADWYRIHKWL